MVFDCGEVVCAIMCSSDVREARVLFWVFLSVFFPVLQNEEQDCWALVMQTFDDYRLLMIDITQFHDVHLIRVRQSEQAKPRVVFKQGPIFSQYILSPAQQYHLEDNL